MMAKNTIYKSLNHNFINFAFFFTHSAIFRQLSWLVFFKLFLFSSPSPVHHLSSQTSDKYPESELYFFNFFNFSCLKLFLCKKVRLKLPEYSPFAQLAWQDGETQYNLETFKEIIIIYVFLLFGANILQFHQIQSIKYRLDSSKQRQ